jgi:hypothetical protein
MKGNELQILEETITRLRVQRAQEWILLRDQFHLTYESLKPINLLKHTIKEVSSSNEVKTGVVNNIMGVTTGYLARAMVLGSSSNPIKKIIGNLLQFAVAAFVTQNSGPIKSIGKTLWGKLFKKPSDHDLKVSHNGNSIKNLKK